MKCKNLYRLICLFTLFLLTTTIQAQVLAGRWSEQRANKWYAEMPWISGCNYIPSNAINQIEMWSAKTFDPKRIDQELGWAQQLGFKTMRVFLSSVVYEHSPKELKKNISTFLDICQRHNIRPFFVFFDDCWNAESSYGDQPAPKTGVHNSGWVQDPSVSLRNDTTTLFPKLERYVKDIVKTFGQDKRVLMWDLYNEPGNGSHFGNSLPLLLNAFQWARSVNPSQPLTAGVWNRDKKFKELNAFQLNNSDVISYHDYRKPEEHAIQIEYLLMLDRPLICTEYMARRSDCYFYNTMPMLKKHNVMAINWGFVTGKTNTRYAWNEPYEDGSEPLEWFHDILNADGTPHNNGDITVIKTMNGVK